VLSLPAYLSAVPLGSTFEFYCNRGFVGACLGQGAAGGMLIQTQNAGVTNGTFKKYFVLNCVSGLNCSVSGSTLSIGGSFTDARPQLTLGANGGVAGQLTLAGSTSGSATFTARAVAGTSVNAVVLSNALQVARRRQPRFNQARLAASIAALVILAT
jgi:hypothetical protein